MKLSEIITSKKCSFSNLSAKSTEWLKKQRASYLAVMIGVALAGLFFIVLAIWTSAPEILVSSLGIFAALLPIYVDGYEKINRELRDREDF